jgi:hypothetical protein
MLQRYESRNSSVSIETGYGLDGQGPGVRVPLGTRFFSAPRRPGRFSYPVGSAGSFRRVKAAGA